MIFPQVKCVISLFVYFIPLPRSIFPFVCTLGEKSLQHLGDVVLVSIPCFHIATLLVLLENKRLDLKRGESGLLMRSEVVLFIAFYLS